MSSTHLDRTALGVRTEASPLVQSLLDRARAEVERGNADAARGRFAAAISVDLTPASRCALAAWLAERGEWGEAVQQMETAWDHARRLKSPRWRARCCHLLADLHRTGGRRELAERYRQWGLRAELDAEGEIDPRSWIADRAADALQAGHPDDSERGWRTIERASPSDSSERAVAIFNRGVCHVWQDRWWQGLRAFRDAFRVFRRQQDWFGCARAVVHVGHVLQNRRQWRRARACFEHAARLYQRLGAEPLRRDAETFARECRRFEAAVHGDPTRN